MNEILVVKIPVKKKGESVHMKKVVAMYEQEEAYGKNLAEYVNRKENMPFELQVFSQADKLSDYLSRGIHRSFSFFLKKAVWNRMERCL